MQPTANTETDQAFDVAAEISHTVPWRVTSVTVLADARLDVTFVDGTSGRPRSVCRGASRSGCGAVA